MLPTRTLSTSSTLPLIPEILQLICEQLKSHKASLASLARTCRAFENPALGVLWFKLDCPHLLMMCLPSKLWTIETREQEYGRPVEYMVLRGPLIPADCARFSRYAQKVKDFSFGNLYLETLVDNTIFQGLQFAMPGAKILPNIQALRWPVITTHKDYLSFMHMFLGPHLTEIDFYFSPRTFPPPISLFTMLCELYPLLEKISFKYSLRNDTQKRRADELISNMAYNLQNLQRLAMSNLTYEALIKISMLPNLKCLKSELWRPGVPDLTVPACGFPALTQLVICAKCAVDCVLLLEALNKSPIESISLRFEEVESSESWKKLCIAINEHCRHDTVKAIKCIDGYNSDAIETPSPALGEIMLSYESIRPLLIFRNLRTLNIESFRGFYISDPNATEEMAMNWTKIESLMFTLSLECRTQKWSKITLLDLLPFAQHCPDLFEFGLFVNASDAPDLDDQRPGNGISQTTLTSLYVEDSPAGEPGYIAAFLISLFPNLSSICTIEMDGDDDGGIGLEGDDDLLQDSVESWGRVNDLLPLLSAVRQEWHELNRG